LGIERRLETAGKNKSLLDPFKEETKEDKKRLRDLLDSIHKHFKSFVKERRGDKLKQPDEVLFEGDFWLAEKAVDFGLVDGIGDIRTVLRSKFGDDVMLPLISRPPSFLMPFDVGAADLSSLGDGLRTSQYWERLGL
jgi:ClpP class serine protease